MAQKIEVLPWNYFKTRKEVAKEVAALSKRINWKKVGNVAVVIAAGVTFALMTGDHSAFAASGDAVPAMAGVNTGEFSERLRQATKPIRDIIMSFGHEIYAVMMLWGGIEALIGKFQQGVARMKASTIAYILLVWVPWIVDTVTATAVH